jgi:predicted transcriptional regulator
MKRSDLIRKIGQSLALDRGVYQIGVGELAELAGVNRWSVGRLLRGENVETEIALRVVVAMTAVANAMTVDPIQDSPRSSVESDLQLSFPAEVIELAALERRRAS